MRIPLQLIPSFIIGLSLMIAACSSKKSDEEQGNSGASANADEWEEMDEFHMVMAEAFHPYKDSANLGPAKQHAALLVAAADKWASATLPEKFAGDDEMKFKLNQLKADAAKFEEVSKTGDEQATGQSLTKLHDLFHEIQESWYKSSP